MFGANLAPTLRPYLHYLRIVRNEIPHGPSHLAVPSCASKTIFRLVVRLVETVNLSWSDANTVSIETEMRFHMTHVT
jgi:hypothetical protein